MKRAEKSIHLKTLAIYHGKRGMTEGGKKSPEDRAKSCEDLSQRIGPRPNQETANTCLAGFQNFSPVIPMYFLFSNGSTAVIFSLSLSPLMVCITDRYLLQFTDLEIGKNSLPECIKAFVGVLVKCVYFASGNDIAHLRRWRTVVDSKFSSKTPCLLVFMPLCNLLSCLMRTGPV